MQFRVPAFLQVFAAWAVVLLLMLTSLKPQTALAQEKVVDVDAPIIINVASVERLLNQAIVAFEAAGRPELAEVLGDGLEKVNDLKGLDRSQSAGVMIFLNGLTPEPVAYVPVKNIDELLKTVAIGPFTVKTIEEGRYEIITPRQTLQARVRGDYAFVATNAAALDRKLTDPSKITAKLSTAYDLAVTFNLKSILPTTKDLFLGILRANAENGFQRRDNEPVTAHRIRKAAGMRNFEAVEQLLQQGDELTVGWTVSGTDKAAALEVVAIAKPDSELASYFKELKGTRSHFANLLQTQQPLTGSLSWKIDKSGRKMLKEIVAAVIGQVETDLAKDTTTTDDGKTDLLKKLSKTLNATAETGHLDAAVQFSGQPPKPFVFVAGLHVAESDTLASALSDIVSLVKGKPNTNFSDVKLNALTHKGIAIHRLDVAKARQEDQRLYGEKVSFYVGAGESVLWFAAGGDEVESELKRAIDKVLEPVPANVSTVPLQFVMNFSRWMEVFDPKNKPEGLGAQARNAFAQGGDALRVDVRAIEDGLRFRLQLDAGFIRLIGSTVARRIDDSMK